MDQPAQEGASASSPKRKGSEVAYSSFLSVTVVAGASLVAGRGISRPSTLQRTYACARMDISLVESASMARSRLATYLVPSQLLVVTRHVVKVGGSEATRSVELAVQHLACMIDAFEDETTSNALPRRSE